MLRRCRPHCSISRRKTPPRTWSVGARGVRVACTAGTARLTVGVGVGVLVEAIAVAIHRRARGSLGARGDHLYRLSSWLLPAPPLVAYYFRPWHPKRRPWGQSTRAVPSRLPGGILSASPVVPSSSRTARIAADVGDAVDVERVAVAIRCTCGPQRWDRPPRSSCRRSHPHSGNSSPCSGVWCTWRMCDLQRWGRAPRSRIRRCRPR